MKITSIKQQVKQRDRYSIYIDDGYSFSLSESALLRSGIASGQELSKEQVDNFKNLSTDDKLYNRALRYVAMRSRTTWELQIYLQRKEAPPALVEQITGRLLELDLLNDARYADSFVRDRQLLRPTSRRKLQLELKQKHLPSEVIETALTTNDLNETDSLQAVIAKKRRQGKYQDDTKLMQYLARQGFGYGDIKTALNSISDSD